MAAEEAQQAPFVKQLAANDRPTRDKAVASLRTFLSGRRKFEELELLKLWKGLFFCMWMSDRPRPQQRLAGDLADLVAVLPESNVLPFLSAFWKTMAREWTNIDVLRMDKFLLLTRSYLAATFNHLARLLWAAGHVSQQMDLLSSIPLAPLDNKLPNGLRYHVIDIYVDELDKVDRPRSGIMPIGSVIEPLRKLEKESPTKSVRERAKEALKDPRIPGWNEEELNEGDDESADEEDI